MTSMELSHCYAYALCGLVLAQWQQQVNADSEYVCSNHLFRSDTYRSQYNSVFCLHFE